MRIHYTLVFITYTLFVGCNHSPKVSDLHGAWKTDSTIKYYNGFSRTEFHGDDWANYIYRQNGEVLEARAPYFRKYHFSLESDGSLIYTYPSGDTSNVYKVIELSSDKLVLKKDKKPVFQGKNEDRFEYRYFSKSDSSSIFKSLSLQLPNG